MKMTESTKAKIMATKTAIKKARKTQLITVDQDWQIRRNDELNWDILYKGKFKGYYGDVFSDLQALPCKILSEEAKNSLASITASQEAIAERIERAILRVRELAKEQPGVVG